MRGPSTVARRYAEAAFEVARRDGTTDRWTDDLRTAADMVARPELERVVDNPALPFTARRDVLEQLLRPLVSPQAFNLVVLAAQRGRAAILPAVAAEYQRLVNRERGIVHAVVSSAAPLEPGERDAIADRVREMTGAQAEIETVVDPSLIGGLTVRIGDRLIDASVRGRLERLRHRLVAGAR